MKFVDRVIGGLSAGLGLLCLFEANRLWMGLQGAGLMPLMIGVIFVLLSSALFLFPSSEKGSIKWPSKKESISIGVIGGAFAIYISAMNFIGYPISTWIYLLVVARYISPSRTHVMLIWTGILAFGSYVLFKIYLGAYLPPGFIGI